MAAMLAFGLAGAAAALVPAARADTPPFDPIEAYGDRIVFDVYRKDTRIGSHTVEFRRSGDGLIADSRFEIEISVLGLPVYGYRYTSEGHWHAGRLSALDAETDDDGETSRVQAQTRNGRLAVFAGNVQSLAPEGIFPTTHWNPGVIGARQVLNTITGHINTVEMTERGIDSVRTGDSRRPARHFAYSGELETDVWYDMQGRWVKMRFAGKDGVPIEYRCRACGDTARAERYESHAKQGYHSL